MHSAVNVVGLCGVLVFVRDLARGALPEAVKRKIDSLEEFFVVNVSGCAALTGAVCFAERCRRGCQP